ncbi:MAG: sterol desaturase family protein, partial [Bdellovibrionales bacterium]|nr:sterol desaturase family protein [Bdellovibrionales bacterium]
VALLSTAFFRFVPMLGGDFWKNRKVQPSTNASRSEYLYFLSSLAVFTMVGFVLDKVDLPAQEVFRISLLKSLLIFVVYDLYFYLTHRLLHTPFLDRAIHRIHHRYENPDALSSFAFHPMEGVIQIAVFIPLAMLFQPSVIVVQLLISLLLFLSVYGHCGYELRARKIPALDIFTTSIFHNLHHTERAKNFGIFLVFWDKLFRTISPSYSQLRSKFRKKLN